MKAVVLSLGVSFLQHPSYMNSPTITIDYIGQPNRIVCNRIVEKLVPAGTYVAMIYQGKDQQYARAVSIALPIEANGEQHLTVAYPYGDSCPLIVQLLNQNGRPQM